MTRINCVPVDSLIDKHLLAEYHELPRVFTLIRAYENRLKRDGYPEAELPAQYNMGKGHVRFFYNKAPYLMVRYRQLVAELERRRFLGVKPIPVLELIRGIDLGMHTNWVPDAKAKSVNQSRIKERVRDIQARDPGRALRRSIPAG